VSRVPTFPSIKSSLPSDLKVDLRAATKPLYAGAGVTDLAVELVRDYVTEAQKRLADAQKRVTDLDLEPKALRDQATTVVNARVDALAKDARARRGAIEKRVAELQTEAKSFPAKLQGFVDENVNAVNGTYGDLVARGESLVTRIRKQESTQATVASARTTTAKAKTTRTQATKTAKSTTKKAASTAKKRSAAPKSSAKATSTAAQKTASSAAQAATDAAAKVGD
jgi:septal ring factor EnvC (AmiA/AmiB activator)